MQPFLAHLSQRNFSHSFLSENDRFGPTVPNLVYPYSQPHEKSTTVAISERTPALGIFLNNSTYDNNAGFPNQSMLIYTLCIVNTMRLRLSMEMF